MLVFFLFLMVRVKLHFLNGLSKEDPLKEYKILKMK